MESIENYNITTYAKNAYILLIRLNPQFNTELFLHHFILNYCLNTEFCYEISSFGDIEITDDAFVRFINW